ncbi:hypothetical protein JQM66_04870 [Oscillibacter valericigenes]|uniref:hypothetical protein n=1 Tax=Oscillibacter valericigenes TaxID=351091 RepID=UPI001F26A6D9|nr:hypothetical protein [Oscillibacter valericigenes]MCF2663891.1 hypothetical protein [Oscillibacter valericigenes]
MATKGYKIDFTSNTLVMNYKFHSASQEYGTPENKLVKEILSDFPTLIVVVKAGREVKTTNKNKRLTYENMEKHISAYENSAELLDVFETVKALSKTAASPYKYVTDWFVAQFPDYKKAPVFKDEKLTVPPVKVPDIREYKIKKAA